MASLSGALGGAGQGAAIGGSFGGPIGAGVGGAIGGVAGLFSGGQSKEEKELLKKQRELADFQLSTSKEALDPVLKYEKGILSGDRAEQLSAVEPELRSILGQYDTARKANAQFSPRGGGRTRKLSELPFQKITDIQNVLGKVRPEAARALSSIFQELNAGGSGSLFGALRGQQVSEGQRFARGLALGESVGELLNSLVFDMGGGTSGGGGAKGGTAPTFPNATPGFTRKEYGPRPLALPNAA